jgi:hypothetical protein
VFENRDFLSVDSEVEPLISPVTLQSGLTSKPEPCECRPCVN